MIIKNHKGLSVRQQYDIFNIYLFEKESIKLLHDIYDTLTKQIDNSIIKEKIKDNSKLILELYLLGKKIDFGQQFLDFFEDNKIEYNKILSSEYNVSLGIKEGNFYNMNKKNLEDNKDDSDLVRIILLYLQNKYISDLEKYLGNNKTFLIQNYINSKYRIIDDMGKGILRFNIDIKKLKNNNIESNKIVSFINFIKRISLKNLEIRLYYSNISKDNYEFLEPFLELNDEYNNIFHYIYIHELEIYNSISDDMFGDFIKYIYTFVVTDKFYQEQNKIKNTIIEIKKDHNFIGIEVDFDKNFIKLGLESIIYNVYDLINKNWGKVFKFNMEEYLFKNNTNQNIINFIDQNIKYFIKQYNLKDYSIFNINEITIFNIIYAYEIYFNINNINEYIINIEYSDKELYDKIYYLLYTNPFSIYYINYYVDIVNDIIEKDVDNKKLDYPLIESFDDLMSKYNILENIKVNNNNLLPFRNLKYSLPHTENYIINKLI